MAEITTAYGQKITWTKTSSGVHVIGLHDVDPRSGERTTRAEIGIEPHELEALFSELESEEN